MSLSLGVDTGGTFTDAVIVDRSSRKILSAAKALTTKEDLFKGITSAIDQCLENKNISFLEMRSQSSVFQPLWRPMPSQKGTVDPFVKSLSGTTQK